MVGLGVSSHPTCGIPQHSFVATIEIHANDCKVTTYRSLKGSHCFSVPQSFYIFIFKDINAFSNFLSDLITNCSGTLIFRVKIAFKNA